MKRSFIILISVILVPLFSACHKELDNNGPVDNGRYSFSLSVLNDDYTEVIPIKGVKASQVASKSNLPSWVRDVYLTGEVEDGNLLLGIDVKADPTMEDRREAAITLSMTNGSTVDLKLVQWPSLADGTNAVLQSTNTQFENKWYEAKEIDLVVGSGYENGIPNIKTIKVALPWAHDLLPQQHLPERTLMDMMAFSEDWSLVFNLTGILSRPNFHYFGLYNKYSGKLRVFYYITEENIPDSDANDHLWVAAFDKSLAEHTSGQFSLPYNVAPTDKYKSLANVVMTTAKTDSWKQGTAGKVIPSVGWWAFDVDLSTMRPHDFFAKDLTKSLQVSLKLFNQDNVWLDSIMQGSLDGKLDGKMNLRALEKTFTSLSTDGTAAVAAGDILGAGGGLFMNTYFLKALTGGETTGGAWCAVAGCVVSLVGKLVDDFAADTNPPDPDESFGKLDADINLDLQATMTTSGVISGERSTTVPNAEMSSGYIKQKDADGKDTFIGSGVCNIDNTPVIYVVKDAYWYERHAKVFSKSKAFNLEDDETKPVNSYYIAKDASQPGLRLISFLDPTSIGGIRLNTDLYPEGLKNVNVTISYGVFPGSNPGYTNAFRTAIGLDKLPYWTLCTQSSFSTQDNTEFKTFKYPRTSAIFKDINLDEAVFADVVATRLSSQLINGNIERRYYGQSAYYTREVATPEEVDNVQYVSDPEIFVPFSVEKKCLYDPIVPDFVVTVQITANVSTGEGYFITNTMRFVPKIVLISYKDIDSIASQANSRKNSMTGPAGVTVNYSTMDQLLNRLSNFTTAVK